MYRFLGLLGRFMTLSQVHRSVRALLRSQGIGAGERVSHSGETDLIRRLLKNGGRAPVVFDVGANRGAYAEAVLQVRRDARVYCFEPSSVTFAALESAMGRTEGVTLFPFGLSATAGRSTLYSDNPGSGLASLTKRRLDHFNIAMERTETVELRTLDDVLASVGNPFVDLLKIDVEGHEMDVLRGGAQAFSARRIGAVQFEFGGTDIDTRTFLQDFHYFFTPLGYRLLIAAPGRLVPIRRYDEILEQFVPTNYVALPSG